MLCTRGLLEAATQDVGLFPVVPGSKVGSHQFETLVSSCRKFEEIPNMYGTFSFRSILILSGFHPELAI